MGCFRLLGFRSCSQQNAIEVGFAITGSDEHLLYLKRPRTGPEVPLAVTGCCPCIVELRLPLLDECSKIAGVDVFVSIALEAPRSCRSRETAG